MIKIVDIDDKISLKNINKLEGSNVPRQLLSGRAEKYFVLPELSGG